jgi:hypothetical protein
MTRTRLSGLAAAGHHHRMILVSRGRGRARPAARGPGPAGVLLAEAFKAWQRISAGQKADGSPTSCLIARTRQPRFGSRLGPARIRGPTGPQQCSLTQVKYKNENGEVNFSW